MLNMHYHLSLHSLLISTLLQDTVGIFYELHLVFLEDSVKLKRKSKQLLLAVSSPLVLFTLSAFLLCENRSMSQFEPDLASETVFPLFDKELLRSPQDAHKLVESDRYPLMGYNRKYPKWHSLIVTKSSFLPLSLNNFTTLLTVEWFQPL